MIIPAQIRAARAALRWTAKDLAESSGIACATIHRLESYNDSSHATQPTLEKIKAAIEGAGIEFIHPNGGGSGILLKDAGHRNE